MIQFMVYLTKSELDIHIFHLPPLMKKTSKISGVTFKGEYCMGLAVINAHSIRINPPIDAADETSEVLLGLQQPQKTLSPKFFYDQRGSQLFNQICNLVEYYPTVTEIEIMQQNIQDITRIVGPKDLLIEFGSGSSLKTKILLDHLSALTAYVPVDISRVHLLDTAESLRDCYPQIDIAPLWADFTKPFSLPVMGAIFSQKLAYFPGSTIGNFYPQQAIDFMSDVASIVGTGGGFLIGVDLQKKPDILNLAYNDHQGITAAFNLNILTHINRRFQANFDKNQFEHRAFYNQKTNRIEMHLTSKRDQYVSINGALIHFQQGESILTEVSYKYTLEGFAQMALQAGFKTQKVWVDPKHYFSVQYLVAV